MLRAVLKIRRNEIPILFKAIKAGMNIKLYKEDKSVFSLENGQTIFLTITDTYLNEDGKWAFQSETGREITIEG